MKIRFCENSPKGKGKLAKRLLEELPGIDVKVSGCRKQCRLCCEQCFCVVDRTKVLKGANWEEIYAQLIRYLNKESR